MRGNPDVRDSVGGVLRNHWDALTRFLSDGRLPIDNNEAERALRRIAVGRNYVKFRIM